MRKKIIINIIFPESFNSSRGHFNKCISLNYGIHQIFFCGPLNSLLGIGLWQIPSIRVGPAPSQPWFTTCVSRTYWSLLTLFQNTDFPTEFSGRRRICAIYFHFLFFIWIFIGYSLQSCHKFGFEVVFGPNSLINIER